MHTKLKNEKGGVLYLTGKATGLASSSGADKFIINLEEPIGQHPTSCLVSPKLFYDAHPNPTIRGR